MPLEHVAHGQTRLATPGLAPDARGIVLGKFIAMAFPSLEGAVAWFRVFAQEASLDEVLPGLEILRVRTQLGSREVVVKVPAVSSHAADRTARLARLLGGAAYTGSVTHFVAYRDERSPYGYDAVELTQANANELVLHAATFTQTYAIEARIPFERLLFRLSVRRLPGQLPTAVAGDLWLAVERGLAEGVIRYLWRNKVEAAVTLVTPRDRSAFAGQAAPYMLFRARDVAERIVRLFVAVPGITAFVPQGEQVAVALGYQHPIELSACASAFPRDLVHLFWPGDRVDALAAPLAFSPIGALTRIELALEQPTVIGAGRGTAPDPVAVQLELAPAFTAPRRVVGTLIAPADWPTLKRLIFFLPPTALHGHRIALTDRGAIVLGPHGQDAIPLGTPLTELAPGLLVPLGLDVVPRVSPDVLATALGHVSGLLTVFIADTPFAVPASAMQPLERRAIAKLEVDRAEVQVTMAQPLPPPEIHNDPIGGFALWGFEDVPPKALPG